MTRAAGAVVTEADIPVEFSDEEIGRIVLASALPHDLMERLDLPTLARGVRSAMECYLQARKLRPKFEEGGKKTIGYRPVEGRKRPGGKRSKPTLEPVYRTSPRKGRPTNEPEFELTMWLRVAWLETFGEEAPATANAADGKRGPLVRFCDGVFRRAGTPMASSVAMINRLAAFRGAVCSNAFKNGLFGSVTDLK